MLKSKELQLRIKEGSWGSLSELLQERLKESLVILKSTVVDHRYHQARVNTLEEIISLLPNTPK